MTSLENVSEDSILTVHWDGKLPPTFSGKGKDCQLSAEWTSKKSSLHQIYPRKLVNCRLNQSSECESASFVGNVRAMSFDMTVSRLVRAMRH